MAKPAATFLLVLAGLAAIGSFGFSLNDEMDLGSAALSLYSGSLTVDRVPPEYYAGEEIDATPRVSAAGSGGYVQETRAGAIVSYPAFLLLLGWTRFAPLQLAFVVLAAAAFAGGALFARGTRARPRERLLIALAAATYVAASAPSVRAIDDLWLAPVAMQLTTMVLFAAGVAAFESLLERIETPRATRLVLLVLLVGTTITFWAFGQKYHGAQVGFLLLALRARFAPGGSDRRHALAFALAGLAFWWHPKTGGLLVGALLLVDGALLLARWREPRAAAYRAAILALGLAAGAAPYAIENQLLFDAPGAPGYAVSVVEPGPGAGDGGEVRYEAPGFFELVWTALARHSLLGDPGRAPAALYAAWLSPGMLSADLDVQLSVVMVAPLLVLAPLGLFLRTRRWEALDAFLLVHLALVLFVYGAYAATPGGGSYDSRYLHVVYPGLALHAARFLAREPAPAARPNLGLALGLAVLLVSATLALLARLPDDYTLQFHVIRRNGLAVAALVAAWGLVRAAVVVRGVGGRWIGPAEVPFLGLGLFPTLLFAAQFVVHHPPRLIAADAGAVAHFQPAVAALSAVLDSWLGA